MDLQAKFDALELQLATQHSAIGNALDSILTALGAPPPTATITLATVSDQLTAINNNLIGIAIANGSFHTALLDLLGLINVNTDTIITNNSLNAQRLLTAILTTACPCTTDTPFLGPPLDVTPTSLADQDKCRRIQYYLSIFSALIDGIANYGGTGAMVTAATITEILYASALAGGLVGGEVGAAGGPPGIVVGAIVGIIGALIGALGSSYIFQMGSQWHQAPLLDQLLAALYAADSADAGAAAFYDVINASAVLNSPFKPLINALFWNGWANDIYSTTPIVDDSAFDGTICVPDVVESPFEIADCTSFDATPYSTGGHDFYLLSVGAMYSPDPSFIDGDFFGYTWRIDSGTPGRAIMHHFVDLAGEAHFSVFQEVGNDSRIVGDGTHTLAARWITGDDDELAYPFSIEFCPPT